MHDDDTLKMRRLVMPSPRQLHVEMSLYLSKTATMGLSMLPAELVLTLQQDWPCRHTQIKQLAAMLSPMLLRPPTLVIYGPHATGKSGIVRGYMEASGIRHAIIRCRECVTGRYLLERTVAAVHQSLQPDHSTAEAEGYNGRCESLSALVVHLQRLLAPNQQPCHSSRADSMRTFVLVFDGTDQQRDYPPTLLPALARLGEHVPNLTVAMILQHPSPRFLRQKGIPYLHFPPYIRAQSLQILSRAPQDIFTDLSSADQDYDDETHEADKAWLWPRFCAVVWDSLAQGAARDLVAFKRVCHKLWQPFVAPIVNGHFGTRDFSRLLVAQRRLFQDESVLLDSLISRPSTIATAAATPANKVNNQYLPYYAKYILVAAYLASFNPARLDALYFMKSTERKRRKKGGGTARSGGGRPSQKRAVPRHLLPPSPFPLDRLLAILHAILPHDFRGGTDVSTQIVTLAGLGLLVRVGGLGSTDPLEPGGKWKVGAGVSWEYVLALARSIDFAFVDYLAE